MMNKIKTILKFTVYALGCVLCILLIFMIGLTIYDSVRMNRLKSEVAQVKLGDARKNVIQILGEPNYSWNKGDSKFTFWGESAYRKDSGIAYGTIMDWKHVFHSEFPYFFPFKLRLFSPDSDDVVIYFNDKNNVSKIRIPEQKLLTNQSNIKVK